MSDEYLLDPDYPFFPEPPARPHLWAVLLCVLGVAGALAVAARVGRW